MARYGQEFKNEIVARLLPPESASLSAVSREVGVSESTLERWLSTALAEPGRERIWTAAARLDAIVTTASMDEAARSAWCRSQGVFPAGSGQVAGGCSAGPVRACAGRRQRPARQTGP